jgi:hypothetical protein
MTAILERRESESLWGRFCNWKPPYFIFLSFYLSSSHSLGYFFVLRQKLSDPQSQRLVSSLILVYELEGETHSRRYAD